MNGKVDGIFSIWFLFFSALSSFYGNFFSLSLLIFFNFFVLHPALAVGFGEVAVGFLGVGVVGYWVLLLVSLWVRSS